MSQADQNIVTQLTRSSGQSLQPNTASIYRTTNIVTSQDVAYTTQNKSMFMSTINRDGFHQKKLDERFLGKDLDVVCFLLAVEVERLYEENFQMKSKVEALQVAELDRKHYETHIIELTNQLSNKNSESFIAVQQSEQLKKEIDDWKRAYSQLKLEKDKESEIYRQKISQYESELIQLRSANDKIKQYEDKIALLVSEIERWKQIVGQRTDELTQVRGQYEQLKSQFSQYEYQLNGYKGMVEQKDKEIADWKSKYSSAITQISQLQEALEGCKGFEIQLSQYKLVIESKDKEIGDWKLRFSEMVKRMDSFEQTKFKLQEYENKIVLLSSEIEKLRQQLTNKLQENDQLGRTITELQITIQHGRELEGRLQEYEQKISLMTAEIERLNNLLKSKLGEIENLKITIRQNEEKIFQLTEQSKQRDQQNSIFNFTVKDLQDKYATATRVIEELKQQNGQLMIQYKKQLDDNKELENKIAMLSQEIERLNAILETRKREIEDRKQKQQQIEITLLQYRQYEDKFKESEQRVNMLMLQLDDLSKKYQQASDCIKDYRLQEGKVQEYENKILLLSNEIERLNNVIKIKLTENEEWRQKYSSLEIQITKYRQIESKVPEYEQRIALMANEIQRINTLYQQKIQECEEYKNKYNQAVYQFSNTEGRIKELENRCVQLSTEIERLRTSLVQKNNESEEWRTKFYRIQDQIKEYENKIMMMSQERDGLQSLLRERSEEIEKWKIKYNQITTELLQWKAESEKIRVLNEEIDRLQGVVNDLTQENQVLKKHYIEYQSLQIRLQEALIQIFLQTAEVETLRLRMKDKEREVDDIRRTSLKPFRR